jgi:hypothetical protein
MAIMREDIQLYPDIQRGLDASQQQGMLGRSEERIHHFQAWLQSQTDLADSHSTAGGQKPSSGSPFNDCAHETSNCHFSETVAE